MGAQEYWNQLYPRANKVAALMREYRFFLREWNVGYWV